LHLAGRLAADHSDGIRHLDHARVATGSPQGIGSAADVFKTDRSEVRLKVLI
jgi:hypothetical protein